MQTVEFNNLIELVAFDQNVIKLERALAQEKKNQEEIRQQIAQTESVAHVKKEALHEVKKQVDMQELVMRTLDEQEMQCRKKMELATSARESNALQKEMNIILEQKNKAELDLLQAWNKTEQAARDMVTLEQQMIEQVAALQEQLAKNIDDILQHEQALADIMVQRAAKVAGVSQALLDIYQTMRGRVTNPIVPVINQSCQGCFYYVTPQDMQLLLSKKMLQCKDCYRLLYNPTSE